MSLKLEIYKIHIQLNTPSSVPEFLDRKHLPSLDGWRAVAIVIVILGHAKLTTPINSLFYKFAESLIYAELGVRIFFVLSGFLITSLLIKEKIAYGQINARHFFIKRILRIFPVFYVYLTTTFILNKLFNIGLNLDHFLGPFLYLNNFNLFGGTWLTGHTWSLAVEEQFYIVWPIAISTIRNNLLLFCLFLICLAPILKVLYYYKSNLFQITLGPFITNADAIFSGAMISILSFKNFFQKNQKIWSIKNLNLIFIMAILAICFCSHRGIASFLFYPAGNTICNILISLMIVKTIMTSKSHLYFLLNNRIMTYLGLISYSLYIWQQLFIVPTNIYDKKFNFLTFPLNIVLAFIAANFSYLIFERYFLNIKTKYLQKKK